MYRKRLFVLLILATLLVTGNPTTAQTAVKPFVMPVALPPGPSTWLFGQPYGNTTGAYNFGDEWYSAGQGLHFGIDLSMPCRTPLVAVADGEIAFVDNLGFGAGPHNLLIKHAQYGVVSLYGHLLETPTVLQGQVVKQGDPVALSGDPDRTCVSRPHLHFEVRSLDYRTAYNPVDYIEANWHSLAAVGSFSNSLFQQDLTNPRRWMSLEDQPAVAFGGARLNNYAVTYPTDDRAPANAPLMRSLGDLLDGTAWQLRQLGTEGCCPRPWWDKSNADWLHTIDGAPGGLATVFTWSASAGSVVDVAGVAPPPLRSPDGTLEIRRTGDYVTVRRLSDGTEWPVFTGGVLPAYSTDNSRLMWVLRSGDNVPGSAPSPASVWVSDGSGENGHIVNAEAGVSARWLDATRLLISVPGEDRLTTLSIYDTRDDSTFVLGAWKWMRSLSVAPGGGRLMFYLAWNPDTNANGVYTVETLPGAQARHLPWFGGWRWRDADSVFYIPYEPLSPVQTLAYYHIPSGTNRALTDPALTPLAIANGDWDVSLDGQRIAFQSALDHNLWLLEAAP